MAVAVRQNGRLVPVTSLTDVWRKRIDAAKKDRKRYEPVWLENLAFISGKHWLRWSRTQRRLVLPRLAENRQRYTVDELTQYRYTALGELTVDDDRPELLFREGDVGSREFAEQANDALQYWWDNEGDADDVFTDLKVKMIDLGTAAIRVRFDPTVGPLKQTVPHQNGRPILDPEQAHAYVSQMAEAGQQAEFKDIREGRIRLEVGSPFNLLLPPGVEHDRDFPWEVWVRPVQLDKLVEEFGDVALGIEAEPDIAAVDALGARELADMRQGNDMLQNADVPGKLEDAVRLFTCFERPCRDYPDGQVVYLASKDLTPLRVDEQLQYHKPDGTACSGVTYFRFQQVTGRFWGRSLVDAAKDPQRIINKRRSQISEIIDRGQPKVFAEEGSLPDVDGRPAEYIQVKPGTPLPTVWPGISPGPWMQADVEATRQDLARAVGIRDVSLGENPIGVGNYSQLALLKENDSQKLAPIIKGLKLGVKSVVEDVVLDIRRYWGPDKQITVAGPEGLLNAFQFSAQQIPPFYRVQVPSGATLPRSQAAKLKMIEELFQAALNAQQPLPVSWLKESYEAGEPVPLPTPPADIQGEKAGLENAIMAGSHPAPDPAEYDDPNIHIPVHRELQIQAEMSGSPQIATFAAAHIQQHQMLQAQQAQAQMQAAVAAGAVPGAAPGGAPGAAGQPAAPGGFPPFGSISPLAPALAGLNAVPYRNRFS